jgi:hypothetical protein
MVPAAISTHELCGRIAQATAIGHVSFPMFFDWRSYDGHMYPWCKACECWSDPSHEQAKDHKSWCYWVVENTAIVEMINLGIVAGLPAASSTCPPSEVQAPQPKVPGVVTGRELNNVDDVRQRIRELEATSGRLLESLEGTQNQIGTLRSFLPENGGCFWSAAFALRRAAFRAFWRAFSRSWVGSDPRGLHPPPPPPVVLRPRAALASATAAIPTAATTQAEAEPR